MRHRYELKGMHCNACVQKVGAALRSVDGVTGATVTLDPPRAEVEMDRHVPTPRLAEAVEESGGYTLHEADGANHDSDAPAQTATPADGADDAPAESLYPLILIVGYLLGTVLLIRWTAADTTWLDTMRHFMAGFFLVFSFFKLLDPAGFVSAYRGYDLLARRSAAWAWVYPYIELGLGIAYLINLAPITVNLITLVVMLVGAAGVLKALLDRRSIRCACLGTALNLPMTTVTLVEDLTMAVMAAAMLVLHL